jgi:YegS/Rv2252/BmrU family lipid kinase
MNAFVVVNPRSGNGRTAREWPEIERALRAVYSRLEITLTRGRGHATEDVRDALKRGQNEIIAVGGDGTISEAINGFFEEGGSVAPDAVFSFITSGTGGDFRKTLGIASGWRAALARLKEPSIRPVDIGRISCLAESGEPIVRYFINIASFGLSGTVVDSVNRARIAKLFGGKFAFAFHSGLDLLAHRAHPVCIRLDNTADETIPISTVAIANGQYFGGGMLVAPKAATDDGLFDIVIIRSTPKRQSMVEMKLLYAGKHLALPHVRSLRGRRVIAVPAPETDGFPVLIEADGESVGRLPASFEVLPHALKLRC